MNRDQYVELLKNLMPPGRAWPRTIGTTLEKLLTAVAEEFARFDTRISIDLIREIDPREASELLEDWERIVGIPDTVFSNLVSQSKRQQQAYSKLTAQGGQSRAFFISLAARIGFTITITEFKAFRAGISHPGDLLTNNDWLFTWRVSTASDVLDAFLAGKSTAGDPLSTSGRAILEAAINKAKPAHTFVQFEYT